MFFVVLDFNNCFLFDRTKLYRQRAYGNGEPAQIVIFYRESDIKDGQPERSEDEQNQKNRKKAGF
ncbi:hypothetical protein CEQ15_05360 [Chryseobacterium indologenes]|nr:hypothetical protein CEQ15_05360 [Chryseobacterium indologenes]